MASVIGPWAKISWLVSPPFRSILDLLDQNISLQTSKTKRKGAENTQQVLKTSYENILWDSTLKASRWFSLFSLFVNKIQLCRPHKLRAAYQVNTQLKRNGFYRFYSDDDISPNDIYYVAPRKRFYKRFKNYNFLLSIWFSRIRLAAIQLYLTHI